MLRFASQLCVDNLPDEQLTDQFEVIMPTLELLGTENGGDNLLERAANSLGMFKYTPIVEEIVFGQMGFNAGKRRVRTGWYKVPDDIKEWDIVKISMFCSAAMTTQLYLDTWKSLMYNKQGEYYYEGEHYKKNIEVYINGPASNGAISALGNTIAPRDHYTLVGCFPIAQDTYKFQYEDNPKRFRIQADFSIDKVVHHLDTAKELAVNEMIKSPTSLIDKGLSTLTGSSSEYSLENTYGTKGV